MSCIRLLSTALLVSTAAVAVHAQLVPQAPVTERLTVVRDATTVRANALLVQRVDRGEQADLYFVTAGQLFRDDSGVPLPPATTTVVVAGKPFAVRAADISIPLSTTLDVAVLHAMVPRDLASAPPALTAAIPEPATSFEVSGFDQAGAYRAVQRIRGVDVAAIVGDTPVAHEGCIGSAAQNGDGVFGIVTRCAAGHPPVVVPLAAIAGWIVNQVPGGLRLPPNQSLSLNLVERDRPGPLLTVSCGETRTGELSLPLTLAPGELPVAATARFTERTDIRLGDVSVLKMSSRVVTVRFTLQGTPPPAFPAPAPCPTGQALLTVRLDVLTRTRN